MAKFPPTTIMMDNYNTLVVLFSKKNKFNNA